MEHSTTHPGKSRREIHFQTKAESWRRTRDHYAEKIRGIKSQFAGGVVTHPSAAALVAEYERKRKEADNEVRRALHNAGRL